MPRAGGIYDQPAAWWGMIKLLSAWHGYFYEEVAEKRSGGIDSLITDVGGDADNFADFLRG